MTEGHDVVHDEEVAREAQLADDAQLPVDLGPRPDHPFGVAGPVSVSGSVGGQPSEEAHLVEPVGTRVRRQAGSHQPEVEGAAAPQLVGGCHHARPSGEAVGLLGPRTEVGRAGRRKPPV